MVKRVSRFLWLYVYVLFALLQKAPKNLRTCRVFFIVITFLYRSDRLDSLLRDVGSIQRRCVSS